MTGFWIWRKPLGITLFLIFFSSNQARAETLGFSYSQKSGPDLAVSVQDDTTLLPIPGAQVVTGSTLGRPEQGSTTDEDGELDFPNLGGLQTVTASKDGYVPTTVAGIAGGQLTIFLRHSMASVPRVMGHGEVLGWPQFNDSSILHTGLVFQSLSIYDLLHFDPQSFISPLNDTIDVFGKRNIPSNIVLPHQVISIYMMPITLDKPQYRLPILAGNSTRFVSFHGELPVSDLVSAATSGGKIDLSILNHATIVSASISDVFQPMSDFSLDLSLNIALSPRHHVIVTPPPFAADVMVAALTDLNGDRQTLLPTDVKTAISASNPSSVHDVELAGTGDGQGADHGVLTVAIANKGAQISGIVDTHAGAEVTPGAFLPAQTNADTPTLPSTVPMTAPESGIGAAVFEAPDPTMPKSYFAVWYVYSLPAAGGVEVPTIQAPARESIRRYSTMQMDFGSAFTDGAIDGQTLMGNLRRFTRSTAKVASRMALEFSPEDFFRL